MARIHYPTRTGAAVALLAGALLAPAVAAQAAPVPAGTGATPALTAGGPQGGDIAYGSGAGRCTIGFNARDSGGAYYFLTSGRCAATAGTVWYTNAAHTQVLGTTVAVSFPGDDYGIVKYAAGIIPPGTVRVGTASQDIASAANAFVGEAVKRSGGTTGVHSGSVTAVNVTVNYAEGSVGGLVKTNLCSEAGDTGGPVFDGTKAIGMVSGGSGNCTSGGTTYVQPVTEPLAAYGLAVY